MQHDPISLRVCPEQPATENTNASPDGEAVDSPCDVEVLYEKARQMIESLQEENQELKAQVERMTAVMRYGD